MSLLLGFGSTETERESSIIGDISNMLKKLHETRNGKKNNIPFHEDDLRTVELELEKIKITAENQYQKYKNDKQNRPERYYYIINGLIVPSNTMYDVFIGIEFFHINSQHPLSHDGFAGYSSKKIEWIHSY